MRAPAPLLEWLARRYDSFTTEKMSRLMGRYNKWIARVQEIRNVGQGRRPADLIIARSASMLVTREFIDKLGLMEEGYFLYCEAGLGDKGKRSRVRAGSCPTEVSSHKEGASIGTDSRDVARRSEISDFIRFRSRILLTKRFFPHALQSIFRCFWSF